MVNQQKLKKKKQFMLKKRVKNQISTKRIRFYKFLLRLMKLEILKLRNLK